MEGNLVGVNYNILKISNKGGNITGIYIIKNKVNNKIYIGQSIDIEKRFKQHKKKAFSKKDKEYNKYLYRAFRKYGLDNFSFEILELCLPEELRDKENYYIRKFNSNNRKIGYNETSGYEFSQYGCREEKHPNHKLTQNDVYYIRECYNNHHDKEEVFRQFENLISYSGFSKIWNGLNWKTTHYDVYTEENKSYYLLKRNSHPGSKNPNSKMSEEMVLEIRKRKKNKEKMKDVYLDYKDTGITEASFKQIWCYQNWKNIVV